MTPRHPANEEPAAAVAPGQPPGPAPVAPPKVWRGRRWAVLAPVVLLLSVAVAARVHRRLPDPPLPADIRDAEVLQTLTRARQQVLDRPRSAIAWGRYGMVLLGNLFDRDADRCFAEAARLDPADPRWPYCRGLIALKRDADKALPFLRQAAALGRDLETSPESARDHAAMRLQLAQALLERQELDEAEALFREEWQRHPGHPRAALGLGLIAVQRGEDDKAEEYLTAAQSSPFAQKAATAQLAALARARDKKEAAEAATRLENKAAELPDDPPWPDPLLDEIVELQVGIRGLDRRIGHLEFEHRYADAAELYQDQLAVNPTARNYIGAGVNLCRLRDYDQAMKLLREAVRIEPDSAQAQYTLALAVFARAERQWKQNPGTPVPTEAFREAAGHARRATELRPDYGQAYLCWGLSLKYLGETAAAVAPLRKGVECMPSEIELQLGLGECLLDTDQLRDAAAHLENARKLDPKDPRPAAALERLRRQK